MTDSNQQGQAEPGPKRGGGQQQTGEAPTSSPAKVDAAPVAVYQRCDVCGGDVGAAGALGTPGYFCERKASERDYPPALLCGGCCNHMVDHVGSDERFEVTRCKTCHKVESAKFVKYKKPGRPRGSTNRPKNTKGVKPLHEFFKIPVCRKKRKQRSEPAADAITSTAGDTPQPATQDSPKV